MIIFTRKGQKKFYDYMDKIFNRFSKNWLLVEEKLDKQKEITDELYGKMEYFMTEIRNIIIANQKSLEIEREKHDKLEETEHDRMY